MTQWPFMAIKSTKKNKIQKNQTHTRYTIFQKYSQQKLKTKKRGFKQHAWQLVFDFVPVTTCSNLCLGRPLNKSALICLTPEALRIPWLSWLILQASIAGIT